MVATKDVVALQAGTRPFRPGPQGDGTPRGVFFDSGKTTPAPAEPHAAWMVDTEGLRKAQAQEPWTVKSF